MSTALGSPLRVMTVGSPRKCAASTLRLSSFRNSAAPMYVMSVMPTSYALDTLYNMYMKTCSKCGQIKPLDEFYKDRSTHDGYWRTCKECARGYQRQRRADPEVAERGREVNRQYHKAKREQITRRKREYFQTNPDGAAGRRDTDRRRWQADPQSERAEARRYRAGIRRRVLAHYGEQCACCGRKDRLTIDHVNGDGGQHRAELWGRTNPSSYQMYAWLIKNDFPPGFQTLCQPCNGSKRNGARCRLHGEGAE